MQAEPASFQQAGEQCADAESKKTRCRRPECFFIPLPATMKACWRISAIKRFGVTPAGTMPRAEERGGDIRRQERYIRFHMTRRML